VHHHALRIGHFSRRSILENLVFELAQRLAKIEIDLGLIRDTGMDVEIDVHLRLRIECGTR
jgi:hypothetical protein